MCRMAAVALLTITFCTPAKSQGELSAFVLSKLCVNPEAGFCAGYVTGYLGSYQEMAFLDNIKRTVFCLPKGYTNGQGARVLKKWLDDNPDKLNLPARHTVPLAFLEAWPCKPS